MGKGRWRWGGRGRSEGDGVDRGGVEGDGGDGGLGLEWFGVIWFLVALVNRDDMYCDGMV